ncbi:MAG TPA: glucan biosynthesis protein [Polyangiaceae bacterium]|jgi:glucans biosynthesis protein|nr:glucan biosynthesis protein [Polyangiaceae bacterium]
MLFSRRSPGIARAACLALLAGCAHRPGNSDARNREQPEGQLAVAALTPGQPAPRTLVVRSAAPTFEQAPAFFEQLSSEAQALAEKPAALPPQMQLPPELANLDYDGYRNIRFRPERSLWRGEPGRFEVQFFHPGPGYRDPVSIAVLDHDRAQAVPFSTDLFTYQGLEHAPPGEGLQFTGFRVHTPLNREDYRDELIAFHGASYFRALGKGTVYGVSARGLAIDLGSSKPEEFPVFTRFYLQKPGAGDRSLWILALLESRRATGAYAFRVQPGESTWVDVDARVFLRDAHAAIGLAPLSSMYLCGEEAPNCFGDFRPEIHDSDGLAFWASNGERLFRPLRNPKHTVTSSFRLDSPRGFGLLQRDRTFDHYQDLEAHYQDRPSVWVQPVSGFERGSLRLLEIAARAETGDNIALAWVPDAPPGLPERLDLRYRLHFAAAGDWSNAPGQVAATRIARTARGVRFLVDFAVARPYAPAQGAAGAPASGVEAMVSASNGRVIEQHLEDNPFAHTLRASFEVEPEGKRDVELRAFLKSGADTLTETWSYAWQNE